MKLTNAGFKALKITTWTLVLTLAFYITINVCSVSIQSFLNDSLHNTVKSAITDFSHSILCTGTSFIPYSMQKSNKTVATPSYVSGILFPIDEYILEHIPSESDEAEILVFNEPLEEDNDYETDNHTLNYNDVLQNDTYFEDLPVSNVTTQTFDYTKMSEKAKEQLALNLQKIKELTSKKDLNYLISNFYTVNSSVGIQKSVFNIEKLISKDIKFKKDSSKPQILIYHTHYYEDFIDSRKGKSEDTIQGVGELLKEILEQKYGFNVIHIGKLYNCVDTSKAYTLARPELEKILKENPSIEVVIDMHRDGVSADNKTKTTVEIDGTNMAKFMFFNGVSCNTKGPIEYLNNPNLSTNLAFGLQMKLFAMQQFPELTKKNFLRSYRYNLDLRGLSTLIEVGDNNNTLQEAKNAMYPLAEIINQVVAEQ